MDAIKEAAHKTFMKLVAASEKAYAEQNLTPEYYAAEFLKRLKREGRLSELELLFTVFIGHGVTTGLLSGLSPPLPVVLPPHSIEKQKALENIVYLYDTVGSSFEQSRGRKEASLTRLADLRRFIERTPESSLAPPQPKTQSKPLTFEELEMGDYFVAFPADGDDSGHGGYRSAVWLMRKLNADYDDPLRDNYLRMYDHQRGHLPAHFAVYKVGL